MTGDLLVTRELALPGGASLVVGVQYAPGLSPMVVLAVYRDGRPVRSLMVHSDALDALARVLAAHRAGVAHVEEVPGPTATLRIESREGEIVLSRHRDGMQLGAARSIRDDEAPSVAEALQIAREGA